jgi:myo-inositol-1-phosphate synthase
MNKLGVVIVGVHGAVASTLIAGVELMQKGLAPRIGMVTEKTDAKVGESVTDWLDFAPLEGLVFGGWDPRFKNVFEAAQHHKVLPFESLRPARERLEALSAWPAVGGKSGASSAGNMAKTASMREEIDVIRGDIRRFKEQHGLDRVVLVNLASTEPYLEISDVHRSIEAFEKGLDRDDPGINASMRYFYAANELGVPFCNFTPSLSNVPALAAHAERNANPFAGMDGKTGQTLLKTALAALFRVRRLHIEGWYSTNILGNNDGLVLADPAANKTKVESKASVLDSIVGYHVDNHQVHIHYYRPRGDSKEAWDAIDLVGFGGVPIQMKIDFLCEDSVLAAPLVIDLVRLLDVAKQNGEKGIQRQLSLFFKSPYAEPSETPVHDLFKQERLLLDWARHVGKKVSR